MMKPCRYCGQYAIEEILIDVAGELMHPGCAEVFEEEYNEFLQSTSDEGDDNDRARD